MFNNARKHVGSGKNVNMFTLARNALPSIVSSSGWAFTPLTIFLSVNSACNMRCKMCDIGQRNKDSSFYKNLRTENSGATLQKERLEQLLAEAASFSPKPRISVTTTEPFLYKGIFDIARLSQKYGLEFQVTTNGSLIPKYMDEVLHAGITELCVSVDGHAALHDEIRGCQGLYDTIVDGLEQIHAYKLGNKVNTPQVTIASTISNFNYDRLDKLFEVLDERLYDRAIVSHMNFIDEGMVEEHNNSHADMGQAEMAGLPGDTDNFKVDVDALWRVIGNIKKLSAKATFAPDYNLEQLKTFYYKPESFVENKRCYIPWAVMEILANGDVIPLTRCIHLRLGNVYENTLGEIWNGEHYRKLRKQLIEHKRFPICRRCRGIL